MTVDGHFAISFQSKMNACPMDVLFCELVPVPPIKYRPIRLFKGEKYENPQTANLRQLLEATETVKGIHMIMSGSKNQALSVCVLFTDFSCCGSSLSFGKILH